MAYRRRRRKSESGQLVADVTYIANRLSWKGALIFGFLLFLLFYWLLPSWIISLSNDLNGNTFKPIVDTIFSKRIHWLEWIGISLGLISVFISAYKYTRNDNPNRTIQSNVGFFSRLLAKMMN